MKDITRTIIFILFFNFSYGQSIDKLKLETSWKVINLIKEKNYQAIKNCFPDEIASQISDNVVKYYVDMGAGYIAKYGLPKDEDLITKINFMPTKEGSTKFYSILFPFPAPKEKNTMPDRMIEISFLEKYGDSKISILNVKELLPIVLTDTSKIIYLNKLNFGIDSISTWRFYYSRGNVINKANSNKEIFAVRGNKEELKSLGIDTLIQKMFAVLAKAPIHEKKFQYDVTKYNGRPESISFRWQYKGDNNFYRIRILINEETGLAEKINDFVEISISPYANELKIYLVKKSDLKQLVSILNNFATKNWGDNYEKNP